MKNTSNLVRDVPKFSRVRNQRRVQFSGAVVKHLNETSEDPVTYPFTADSGGRKLTSEVAANKPNLTKNSEG